MIQINLILKPYDLASKERIVQKVQKKMEDVTTGDYVAMIKTAVKDVLVEEYKEGSGAELTSVLNELK